MYDFMAAILEADAHSKSPTQCICPDRGGTVNMRVNSFTGGIQAMCEDCGKYYFEGEHSGEQ